MDSFLKNISKDTLLSLVLNGYKKLLIFMVFGAIAGFLMFKLNPTTYTTVFVFKTDLISKEYAVTLGDNLSYIFKKNDFKKASKLLNIDTKEVFKINELIITPFEGGLFKIEIYSKDTLLYSIIEKGIKNYILNDVFVKEIIYKEKNYLQPILQILNLEIVQLEQLRNDYQKNPKNYSLTNPTDLNKFLIESQEKSTSFKNKLAYLETITFNKDYTFSKQVAKKSLFYLVLKYVLIASIAGFIYILLQEYLFPFKN